VPNRNADQQERTEAPRKVLGVSALALQFAGRLYFGYAIRILSSQERLCFRFGLLKLFLGWGRNFVPVIVIVIAGAAANLCCLSIHQGHNRVIRDTATLYTMVVNNIAQPLFTHHKMPDPCSISSIFTL
jgi:hypothetical protein